jgi:hypothetical protein
MRKNLTNKRREAFFFLKKKKQKKQREHSTPHSSINIFQTCRKPPLTLILDFFFFGVWMAISFWGVQKLQMQKYVGYHVRHLFWKQKNESGASKFSALHFFANLGWEAFQKKKKTN